MTHESSGQKPNDKMRTLGTKAEKALGWSVVALTLAVFALYIRHLGRQSLWFDEGLSVVFASRAVPQLFHTLVHEDLHPPLYYLMLHFWMALAGSSEWAVRLPSAISAVLLVPLTAAVVREIYRQDSAPLPRDEAGRTGTPPSKLLFAKHGPVVALGAAALVGTSPFVAYYAQEARMYSLAAMLSLATVLAFLKATRPGNSLINRPNDKRRLWLLFSFFLAASLYTQCFSAFLMPVFALYAILLDRKALGHTMLHLGFACALYIPWAQPAYRQMERLLRSPDYWTTTRMSPVLFVRAIWSTLLPGVSARWLAVGVLLVALGTVVLAHLLRRTRARLSSTAQRSALLLLSLIIPMGLTYVAVTLAPKFAVRYTIVSAAPLYISASLVLYGLLCSLPHPVGDRVAPMLFAGTLLVVIALSLRSAMAITAGHESPRDDARGLAAYLTQNALPNDAVLLVEAAPYALQYYYKGATPWYGLHVGQDFQGAADALNRILQSRPRRVWLVLWHREFADPSDMVVTELLRVGSEVDVSRQFLGHELRAFDIIRWDTRIEAYPQPQAAAEATFEPGLGLLGFDRWPAVEHERGDSGLRGRLYYVLYWRAERPLERNYSLTLSLEDRDGNAYVRHDQALSTPYFLPPAWPVLTPIRGRVDLTLPADLPPLVYDVYLRVLDPQARRNLDLLDATGNPLGQRLLLEQLPLSKSALSTLPVAVPQLLNADLGDGMRLLGFDLPQTIYTHGDTLQLSLWWQSVDAPSREHQARFRLVDSAGNTAWRLEAPLIADHPTTRWQAGEINRAIYRWTVSSQLAGGQYRVEAGTEDTQIVLTTVSIEPREHRWVVPPMQEETGAHFEGGIKLLGYDLRAPALEPGATVTVTLFWQTAQPIDTSYKVSVQLLSSELKVIAQEDSIPVNWRYPTTAWLPEEVVVDEHVLAVPRSAPEGRLVLIALLYEESSGRRVPVQSGYHADHVVLTYLRIQSP